ncbi:yellowish-green 1-like protein [Biscogniauxia sp. FL1348]|nr:yellowish-green 1-like protein [Biscogniauxia sp. FL1348]
MQASGPCGRRNGNPWWVSILDELCFGHTLTYSKCDMGVYPFMFGATKDFQPVVDEIVAKGLKPPYDWDEYAQCFFPKAEELVASAKAAEEKGKLEEASELYLRGSALYRIARFPAPRSEKQRYAWTKGKEAAIKGLGLQHFPMVEVEIPHPHAKNGDGSVLPGYYHLPANASSSHKAPLIIIFTGLDGYRTELAVWKNGWAQLGCATLIVEIPGTGDNPGAPSDPLSPDRVWTSMFEWVARQQGIDQSRVVNWGFSTGGYYSIRMAHTHADKLRGVVALGGGCHHMFDPEWLDAADFMEYPFDLAHTLCYKFGYGDDFDRFKGEARDVFSLLSSGILDKPGCARLLLVNGTDDEIFPIDDYQVCLQHGDPKEARFITGTKHMGEPASFFVILRWIFKLLDIQGDPVQFLSTLPFQPKF